MESTSFSVLLGQWLSGSPKRCTLLSFDDAASNMSNFNLVTTWTVPVVSVVLAVVFSLQSRTLYVLLLSTGLLLCLRTCLCNSCT